MAPESWDTKRVVPGDSYWTVALNLLRKQASSLATDDRYVQRVQRRLIQLNQHDNPSADDNLLLQESLRVPDMSSFLLTPHQDANGQVWGAPELQSLQTVHGLVTPLSGAIFTSDVHLDVLDIGHDVCFCGATFQGSLTVSRLRIEGFACFQNCDFFGQVIFRDLFVVGDLSFDGATFRGDLVIDRVQVLGSLSLTDATMESAAWVGAQVERATYFGYISGAPSGFYLQRGASEMGSFCVGAQFAGSLHVLDHRSSADLAITQTTVATSLDVRNCHVDGTFSGRRLDIGEECRIDPVVADRVDIGWLRARGSAFIIMSATTTIDMLFLRVDGLAALQTNAGYVDGSGMLLAEGGSIDVSGGAVYLEGVSFPANTILRGPESGLRPILRSLVDSRVTGLAISRLHAGDCSFEGTHDLDKLRVEDDVTWGEIPRFGRSRWATRRQVLHEEAVLRAGRGADRGLGDEPVDAAPPGGERRAARRVAEQYRALRKGFEDRKNEPGAADFYYGEMEMRRLGASGRAERLLLTIYWLVSGYSLRAWRALLALGILLALSTILVAWGGFAQPSRPEPHLVAVGPEGTVESFYVDPLSGALSTDPPTAALGEFQHRLLPALTYSAESATVVFRGPETHTTTTLGRWCQIVLRLLGPALLALAVVSLRGRVKR